MDWKETFQEIWPLLLHLGCQGLFIMCLYICQCTGCLGGSEPTRKFGSAQNRNRTEIQAVIKRRRKKLSKVVSDVIVTRLHDGLFKFSSITEEAERKLFEEVNAVLNELNHEQQKNIEVKRRLKMTFMMNPFDLRGARRLHVLLETYKNCLTSSQYNPGMWKITKRKISNLCLFSCTKQEASSSDPESSPTSSSTFQPPDPSQQPNAFFKFKTFVMSVSVPVLLVLVDMFYSDTMVIYRLGSYIVTISADTNTTMSPDTNISMQLDTNSTLLNNTDPGLETMKMDWILWGMLITLCCVYMFSFSGMLGTPFLSSLRTSYLCGLSMQNINQELADIPTPIGAVTRYNLSLDEAGSEAGLQSALQWTTYLVIQLLLGNVATDEASSFKFNALIFSGFTTMSSLTMGQVKGNKLWTEFQTTLPQQICFFFAALASTVASQLMVTLFLLTEFDAAVAVGWLVGGGVGGGIASAVVIFACIWVSSVLAYSSTIGFGKETKGSGVLTALPSTGQYWLVIISMQALNLSTSKAKVRTPYTFGCGGLAQTLYLGTEWRGSYVKENIKYHMIMTGVSLAFFIASHVIFYLTTSSTKMLLYTSNTNNIQARKNFLLIATICIPTCWLLSQLLEKLFLFLDLGSLTCGARFRFDEPESSNDTIVGRTRCCSYGCRLSDGNCPCCSCCSCNCYIRQCLSTCHHNWTSEVEFVSQTGRWVEESSEDSDDTEEGDECETRL